MKNVYMNSAPYGKQVHGAHVQLTAELDYKPGWFIVLMKNLIALLVVIL